MLGHTDRAGHKRERGERRERERESLERGELPDKETEADVLIMQDAPCTRERETHSVCTCV